MIPGCGPVGVAADEGIAEASVGEADDGEAGDAGAEDVVEDVEGEEGEDEATFGALLPPLLVASLVLVGPCAADGEVFDAFDAAFADAACPDGEEADPADVAVDAPAAEDPGGITVSVASAVPAAPAVTVAPEVPAAPCPGAFALASGLGISVVVAATGAGITGCGSASRITGDVALSSARVSGNGSGAVAQPDATSATAMSEAIAAIRAPDLPGLPHPPGPPDFPDLQIASDISASCSRAIEATAWSQ